jgi:uncharacterized protein (DUF952 family)
MTKPKSTLVFKIATIDAWSEAIVSGKFSGSSDDVRDGFIHLSAGPQLVATAKRYFSGIEDLCLIAFRADDLGDNLKWETSRAGEVFPHYYGPLAASAALWVRPIPLEADGTPIVLAASWEDET